MRLLGTGGHPYSPATGLPIRSQTVSQMVDTLIGLEDGTRLYLMAPIVRGRKGEYRKDLMTSMPEASSGPASMVRWSILMISPPWTKAQTQYRDRR